MSLDPKMRILLVEDASVMRKMEMKVLSSLGLVNIVEAVDGQDAKDKLIAGEKPDLIISDWNMPNLTGYELLVWIRQESNIKGIPFLMATGRGEKAEMSKAEEAGVSSFIAKPFNADELGKKMKEAVGLEKAADESRKSRKNNVNAAGKVKIKIAHIQITDHLVLGVLKHMIDKGEYNPKHFELETECMSSWNPLAKALETNDIDGACVLAPIAMDLYAHKTPIKLVLFAHRNGSIMVRNKNSGSFTPPYNQFFQNKAFYIPHSMSVHHMLGHMFLEGIGLKAGMPGDKEINVSFEVVPPIQMPQLIAENKESSGYLVAEPLGTKGIAAGNADQQLLSSELWENHPCCVITLQEDFVSNNTEAVYELTDLLVKAGKFIETKPGAAAEIAVNFLDPDGKLGLKVPLLKNVLTEPLGIKTDDLFPSIEDLETMQNYMHDEMNLGKKINLKEFVDLRFASAACNSMSSKKKSVLHNSAEDFRKLLEPAKESLIGSAEKAALNMEGKYLMFALEGQNFGIEILKVREIIRMVALTEFPGSPSHVLGVITLRENVIPVIDPRAIFGMNRTPDYSNKFIIVLDGQYNGQDVLTGILVDSVTEVKNVKAAEIEEPPAYIGTISKNYIMAIAKSTDRLNILLDTHSLLNDNQFVIKKQAS
ncbi:MAG: chemotaxis protein CheW [Bacteroidetes bacterium]|nr:chemotaxis protein CheW [Bacteroidota bacterium]